jgi:hypothetical protein
VFGLEETDAIATFVGENAVDWPMSIELIPRPGVASG